MRYVMLLLALTLCACGKSEPAASSSGATSTASTYSQLVGGTWQQPPGSIVGDYWYRFRFYSNHQVDCTYYEIGAGGTWNTNCTFQVTELGDGAMRLGVVTGPCNTVTVTYSVSGNTANACLDESCGTFARN